MLRAQPARWWLPAVIGGEQENTVLTWKKFPHIAAVRHKQLHKVDAALLTRMGPRFVQASNSLCKTIALARPKL